ncbi:Interferon-induced GTP-binding protein Mx2 [Colletotrichum gloeosporioides]|uniref:Interferon-induced GTP-binding protein Mx2 n=1 Tax=Colletotrichum gloeosporioides TaxID=474922 RepID=A0A8H4CW21_COLGL|nr:Interferon-induced GTP-binding protein Mx2 [Colletotrichum gloeosporioides]KAF3811106.1 Interferon-induced GTP-binding protein Mx2 [Colletotrichum gloeosporioides]
MSDAQIPYATSETSEVVSLVDSLADSPSNQSVVDDRHFQGFPNNNAQNPKDRTFLEDPFNDKASQALFDAMDQLQPYGVDQELHIPQLVIVGGQSTGKSSLLQTLTDIPFPVGAGCCTRFPTRIVSRRTPPGSGNTVKITIEACEWEDHFEYPQDDKYKSYAYTSDRLTVAEFEMIMEEVSTEYMGIKCGRGPGKKNFAKEILRIDLGGPSRSHFSILDLPGIFTNPFSVNDFEMNALKKTIADYMEEPETIVICVADAVTDLANQEIFKMADDLVEQDRFVGVFTKCDLLQDPTVVVELANELGDSSHEHTSEFDCWFVVRSRSDKDNDSFDLQRAENMLFDKPPWNEVREDRRGSGMLKRYLSNLLYSRLCDSVPDIQESISDALWAANNLRTRLGDARSSHRLRQLYLRDAVEKFHAIAKKTLNSPGHLSDKETMVRSLVRESSNHFTVAMREHGHAYEFEDVGTEPTRKLADAISSYYPSDAVVTHHSTASKKSTGQQKSKDTRRLPPLTSEIRLQLKVWQTTELPGLLNTEVVKVLFKEQTRKWEDLAKSHISRVTNTVEVACDVILNQVFKSDGSSKILRSELEMVLSQFRREGKSKALDELKEYCRRERELHLQTTDPRFTENLEALRSARLLKTLKSMPKQSGDLADPMSHAGALLQHFHHSAGDNMVQEVHDIVKSYYQISLDSFVRYVNNHIVESFISDTKGPLLGLSTDWMFQLTEEKVDSFAREDDKVIQERTSHDLKIERLLAATKIMENIRSMTCSLENMDD